MSDWRQRLVKNMIERDAKRREKRGWMQRLHLFISPAMADLVDKAAKRRNMTKGSYIRRALAVVVGHDLGIPWREVNADNPVVLEYGKHGHSSKGAAKKRDDGEGFGDWDFAG